MDLDILHLFGASRDNFIKYKQHVNEHLLNPETRAIIKSMEDWYAANPGVTSMDWVALSSFILSCDRYLKHLGTDIKIIIDRMPSYTPTISYDDVVRNMIEKDYSSRIALECEEVRDGKSSLEEVHVLATQGLQDMGRFIDVSSLFVEPDISSVSSKILSHGYNWRLSVLNKSLGPLRPGDFVLIAARVEVGKTTFLASEVSYIANQLPKDRPVIWVNNEEESSKVFFRIVQATLGKTTFDLEKSPKDAMDEYDKIQGSRSQIRVLDGKANDEKILTGLFREVNPGLIVFDQLDKVNGFHKAEREDIRLGQLYKWARELAREYGPVLAASQLSAEVDSFPDPHFIGMDSLRGSKTDKPGEADAIITIGKYNRPKPSTDEHLRRNIHIPKNKMYGGPYPFDETQRHGSFSVYIDPIRARYHD